MIPTLALSDMIVSLMVVGFVFVSVLLILVILIQRPQGGGLSGAFGAGSGSGQTAFGAKTGDALTVATVFMFVVFLGVAIGLVFMTRPIATAPNSPVLTTTTVPTDVPTPADTTDDDAPAQTPLDTTPVQGADTSVEDGDTPDEPTADEPTPTEPSADQPQDTPPGDGG